MAQVAVIRRWAARIACGGAILVAGVVHVPAALAFPYRADFGRTAVLSERPIDRAAMGRVLARADDLLAASPINRSGLSRQLVLTDGGWRWDMLSIGARSSIAFRRPFAHALIFNRSSVAADRVTNGAPLGGVRTLSGTIAHEMTHWLVAEHIGEWAALRLPLWKREGYPDYVAQETSIRPEDEAMIRKLDPDARVLAYYEGRRRVAAELARNGGSVDALLRD
ncbi:hypothetical protein SOM26_07255 [Sphingomonas sp. CFBP8993]|uniref:hypothetical protein n=1 Tax=Sphingomonas sp. CFBP8993 TaxID=3096526 RepID=UPI002A6B7EB0|nr:hypothetical protein [Sphingomonas sp. CFBP8993]MDY0958479.1 hypothetical protein [Sphingomonas sp. CFBP8993]